jgi:hypothetical protein
MREHASAALLAAIAALLTLANAFVERASPMTARRGHTTVLYGDAVVVFGGRSLLPVVAPILSSTHDINGATCPAYSNCRGHGACLVNGTCDCIDGYSGDSCQYVDQEYIYNDVWVYNFFAGAWLPAFPGTFDMVQNGVWPSERYLHTASVVNSTMVVIGGRSQFCTDVCDDLWEMDLSGLPSTLTWTQVATAGGPGKRWMHSTVAWQNRLVLFGGSNSSALQNDVWNYLMDGKRRWRQTVYSPLAPRPVERAGHAVAVSGDDMFVFGGFTQPSPFPANYAADGSAFLLKDLWVFNVPNQTWALITPLTTMDYRVFATAAMSGDTLLVFGGSSVKTESSGVFRYNITSQSWIQQTFPSFLARLPAPRQSATMVYLPAATSAILVGGYSTDFTAGRPVGACVRARARVCDTHALVCVRACVRAFVSSSPCAATHAVRARTDVLRRPLGVEHVVLRGQLQRARRLRLWGVFLQRRLLWPGLPALLLPQHVVHVRHALRSARELRALQQQRLLRGRHLHLQLWLHRPAVRHADLSVQLLRTGRVRTGRHHIEHKHRFVYADVHVQRRLDWGGLLTAALPVGLQQPRHLSALGPVSLRYDL